MVFLRQPVDVGEGRLKRVAHVVNNDYIVAVLEQFQSRVRADEAQSADDQDVISRLKGKAVDAEAEKIIVEVTL